MDDSLSVGVVEGLMRNFGDMTHVDTTCIYLQAILPFDPTQTVYKAIGFETLAALPELGEEVLDE